MRRSLLLFAVLLPLTLADCGQPGTGSDEDLGTIRGTVLLGPTCPVETAESPCPPEPLAGVSVRAVDAEGDVAASAVSDAEGRFVMDVTAGRYTLIAATGDDPARSSKPVTVDVSSGQVVDMDVLVDSGIR